MCIYFCKLGQIVLTTNQVFPESLKFWVRVPEVLGIRHTLTVFDLSRLKRQHMNSKML